MSDLKRYDPLDDSGDAYGRMRFCAGGDYVRYDDVQALREENARLASDRDNAIKEAAISLRMRDEARADRDRLRDDLKAIEATCRARIIGHVIVATVPQMAEMLSEQAGEMQRQRDGLNDTAIRLRALLARILDQDGYHLSADVLADIERALAGEPGGGQ